MSFQFLGFLLSDRLMVTEIFFANGLLRFKVIVKFQMIVWKNSPLC